MRMIHIDIEPLFMTRLQRRYFHLIAKQMAMIIHQRAPEKARDIDNSTQNCSTFNDKCSEVNK